jgi:hypothetical protein
METLNFRLSGQINGGLKKRIEAYGAALGRTCLERAWLVQEPFPEGISLLGYPQALSSRFIKYVIVTNFRRLTMDLYQFVHIEVYARKKSKLKKSAWRASNIAGEAERVPRNCPHVVAPQDPERLFGVAPSVALKHAQAALKKQRDPRGRRIRVDTPCLVAGVASYPIPVSKATEADVRRWAQDCVNHLQATFGSSLKSVLLHVDETYPHIHFFASPADGHAKKLHPGHSQAKKCGKGGYSAGMTNFQNQWFEAVSQFHGMVRGGPKRKRLTARQQAALRLAQAEDRIDTAAEAELKLKKLKAEQAEEAARIAVAGRELIRLEKIPAPERSRRVLIAEEAAIETKAELEKALSLLDSLKATSQRDADRIAELEALLTTEQRERLRLSHGRQTLDPNSSPR